MIHGQGAAHATAESAFAVINGTRLHDETEKRNGTNGRAMSQQVSKIILDDIDKSFRHPSRFPRFQIDRFILNRHRSHLRPEESHSINDASIGTSRLTSLAY